MPPPIGPGSFSGWEKLIFFGVAPLLIVSGTAVKRFCQEALLEFSETAPEQPGVYDGV